MAKGTTLLVLFALGVVGQALTPSTFFTHVDKERLRYVFNAVKPYGEDLESLHYSILGFSLLGKHFEEAHKSCTAAKTNMDSTQLDSVFYAASTKANLSPNYDCKLDAGKAEATLNAAIEQAGATSEQLYQAVSALVNMGFKVDSAKVTTALDEALKADDSPLSHGFAFFTASYLKGDLTKYFDLIEDIVAQADEVDEKYLQFEGGLYTTSIVVDGAYRLATAAKKPPTLTEDKVMKFVNYFLSRKHVQSLKNAATILSVMKTFTDNQFHIPIAVTLASQVSVSDTYPIVQVRVSNLLGDSLGKVSVTADTARHLGDDAVVLSKKPFAPSINDPALYELDFLKAKPARGFYRLSVSVAPQQKDARLLGMTGAEVEVKVTTRVGVENVELSVADKDQGSSGKTVKLQHPNKAANALEADHQQKVVMRFSLRDKNADALMLAHQAFVRLTYPPTGDEIIYVAEADATGNYKFELDVGSKAKEFLYRSGKYNMELIIGDAVIQNPFSWAVADVELTFPEGSVATGDKTGLYAKRPEIKHMFREPEKRPPAVVSSVFTVLVLAPLLLLVVLWMRIGANISGFPFTISAIGFHVGLAGIFGLYYCYFVTLNMFTTLRYLAILGVPTFLFGNRLLSSIAAARK